MPGLGVPLGQDTSLQWSPNAGHSWNLANTAGTAGCGCGWYSALANALHASLEEKCPVKVARFGRTHFAFQFLSLSDQASHIRRWGAHHIIEGNHNSELFFLCKRFSLHNWMVRKMKIIIIMLRCLQYSNIYTKELLSYHDNNDPKKNTLSRVIKAVTAIFWDLNSSLGPSHSS